MGEGHSLIGRYVSLLATEIEMYRILAIWYKICQTENLNEKDEKLPKQ